MGKTASNAVWDVLAAIVGVLAASWEAPWLRTPFQGSSFVLCVRVRVRVGACQFKLFVRERIVLA